MAYISLYQGFVFIEGSEPGARVVGGVQYTKEGFYNQQLKNLDMVKDQMMRKARAMGANAIMDFKYGQKSAGFFRAMLLSHDDNINWYGTGTAIVISPERLEEILATKK